MKFDLFKRAGVLLAAVAFIAAVTASGARAQGGRVPAASSTQFALPSGFSVAAVGGSERKTESLKVVVRCVAAKDKTLVWQ